MTHLLHTDPPTVIQDASTRLYHTRRSAKSALRALGWVASFYTRTLEDLPHAHAAWLYLKERGIGPQARRRYQIGFAPILRKSLLRAATEAGFSAELLMEAGLLVERYGHTGYAERLRGRLTFPIQGKHGSVAGFGARLIEPRPGRRVRYPRYVNTPNTAFFMKGHFLFGLEQAREAMEHNRVCILVEGYADAVALSACGLPYGVAVGGSALTGTQAWIIARTLRSPERPARALLAFDADEAGQRGMEHALPLLLRQGVIPQIVPLPEGEDLADIAGHTGRRGLLYRLRRAQPFASFMLHRARAGGRLDDPATYAEAIREVLSLIRLFPDPECRFRFFLHAFSESRRYGPRYVWTTPEGEAHRYQAWCAAYARLSRRQRWGG